MSLNTKDLSVMAYANGFTLWSYSTADALTAVKGAGYFNDAAPFVRPGDMILVSASKDSAIEPAVLAVTAVAAASVTVTSVAPAAAA